MSPSFPLKALLAVCALGLLGPALGCSSGGSGDDPASEPAPQVDPLLEDLPGVGGGIIIADLFEGAWIRKRGPRIQESRPKAGAKDISIHSPIAVTFSETMNRHTFLKERVRLGKKDKPPVDRDLIWAVQDTLLLIVPKSPLDPGADYVLSFKEGVEDLTGHPLNLEDAQIEFRTSEGSSLRVLHVAPSHGEDHAYRGTDILVAFSGEVATSGSGSIHKEANFRISTNSGPVNGALTMKGDNRIAHFVPSDSMPLGSTVTIAMSSGLRGPGGDRAVSQDREWTFEIIDFASPASIEFPSNDPIDSPVAADGVIVDREQAPSLHAFDVEVGIGSKGGDELDLFFVDPTIQNGFRFSKSVAGATTSLQRDLQPDPQEAALKDGVIKVGASMVRNGVRGPIDEIRFLYKDTDAFRVEGLGPPSLSPDEPTVLLTPLRQPSLYGSCDEDALAFSLSVESSNDVAAIAHLRKGANPVGGTTFPDGDQGPEASFVTTPTSELPWTLAPIPVSGSDGEDTFGNHSKVTLDQGALRRVGLVGAIPMTTDGLEVEAVDDETFQALEGADVIVQPFPIGIDDSALISQTPAAFDAGSLATLGTERISVTVLLNGYHVKTWAGLPNPASIDAEALAISARLEPALPQVAVPIQIFLEDDDALVRVGGNAARHPHRDHRFSDPELPGSIGPLAIRGGGIRAYSALASWDETRYRLAFDLPRLVDEGIVVFDFNNEIDFVPDQSLVIRTLIDRLESDGSGVYDPADPCSDGHCIDRVESRLIAKIPGVEGVLPLFLDTKVSRVDGSENDSEAILLLSRSFIENAIPDAEGQGEDTDLELLIQPSLAGGEAEVSPAALEAAIWTEFALGNEDGRISLARLPIDFTVLELPSPVREYVSLLPVPEITSEARVPHPPLVTWNDSVLKEGVYAVHLVRPFAAVIPDDPDSPSYHRKWTVFVPAEDGIDAEVQYPDLSDWILQNDSSDFDQPFDGCEDFSCFGFSLFTEAFEFDFDDPRDPSDDNAVQFRFERYSTSELERDVIRFARSTYHFILQTE